MVQGIGITVYNYRFLCGTRDRNYSVPPTYSSVVLGIGITVYNYRFLCGTRDRNYSAISTDSSVVLVG